MILTQIMICKRDLSEMNRDIRVDVESLVRNSTPGQQHPRRSTASIRLECAPAENLIPSRIRCRLLQAIKFVSQGDNNAHPKMSKDLKKNQPFIKVLSRDLILPCLDKPNINFNNLNKCDL